MPGLPVLLFLDVSGGELLLIIMVVFLVFGPEKMPEMARQAGRFMNQMKKASNDITREFKKETSSIQSEIDAVHNQVKDQVESVNREFNRTKAQIKTDMKIDGEVDAAVDDKVNTQSEFGIPAQERSQGEQTPVESQQVDIKPLKTE